MFKVILQTTIRPSPSLFYNLPAKDPYQLLLCFTFKSVSKQGKLHGDNHVSYYYSTSMFSSFCSSPTGPSLSVSIVSRLFHMSPFPHFLSLLCLFKSDFCFMPWQFKFYFLLNFSSPILNPSNLTPSSCHVEFRVGTSESGS